MPRMRPVRGHTAHSGVPGAAALWELRLVRPSGAALDPGWPGWALGGARPSPPTNAPLTRPGTRWESIPRLQLLQATWPQGGGRGREKLSGCPALDGQPLVLNPVADRNGGGRLGLRHIAGEGWQASPTEHRLCGPIQSVRPTAPDQRYRRHAPVALDGDPDENGTLFCSAKCLVWIRSVRLQPSGERAAPRHHRVGLLHRLSG